MVGYRLSNAKRFLLAWLLATAATVCYPFALPAADDSLPPAAETSPKQPPGDAAVESAAPAGVAGEDADVAGQDAEEKEYYELFKLLADTLDQVERNFVKDVDRRVLVEAAIRGMLSELDPYSSYIPRQQLERFRTGVEAEFGGVGIQVAVEAGKLRVISPIVGSPAYRCGLMAGDVIVEIDGKSGEGITIDEAIELMKGKAGTQVSVKVLHPGEENPQSLTMTREVIRVDTVLADTRHEDASWNWMYDPQRKIGYVRITAFGRHTAEELSSVVRKLIEQGLRGLVLDLRFNPGGLLSTAIEVCDLFVANGRIVSTEGRNTPTRSWDAQQKGTFEGFPMAVLVNRYSASASEIVSACLQDHDRAVIIGERTWGKGSVQNLVDLEEGASALKLTTADYRRPSGKNIHRFPDSAETDQWGVTPDEGYEVRLSTEEMSRLLVQRRNKDVVRRAGDALVESETIDPDFQDRQLQQALDYLIERLDAPKEQTPEKQLAAAQAAEPAAKPADKGRTEAAEAEETGNTAGKVETRGAETQDAEPAEPAELEPAEAEPARAEPSEPEPDAVAPAEGPQPRS